LILNKYKTIYLSYKQGKRAGNQLAASNWQQATISKQQATSNRQQATGRASREEQHADDADLKDFRR
jgi:hypothetical protein